MGLFDSVLKYIACGLLDMNMINFVFLVLGNFFEVLFVNFCFGLVFQI